MILLLFSVCLSVCLFIAAVLSVLSAVQGE